MRRSFISLVALSVGLVIGGVACSSDTSTSTTTATTTTTAAVTSTNPGPVGSASSELCGARDALRTSITDLTNVDVVRNGTSAIGDALGKVRDNLRDVRAAAGSDVKAQADAFQKSLDDVQPALDASGAAKVAGVVSALRSVATTGATLLTSLGNLNCP